MKQYLLFFCFSLFAIALLAQQPTNVTISGCPDPDFNGIYTTISSASGGCFCYQKQSSTIILTRITAFGNTWQVNTNGNCGQAQFAVTMTGETDCDPTNGPAGINGCVLQEGILPVELTFFRAEERNQTTILFWQTASELNNEKFEIEESIDGQKFQKIGEVAGNGTTTELQEYSFTNERPRNGISYYRLKQIDFDGQFEYSEVIVVNFKGDNGAIGEFYPNPSKSGMVNLDYFALHDHEITVSVFDMAGKLVSNRIQLISNGNNNLSFDFSELNTGIYTIKIRNERDLTNRKLIIQK